MDNNNETKKALGCMSRDYDIKAFEAKKEYFKLVIKPYVLMMSEIDRRATTILYRNGKIKRVLPPKEQRVYEDLQLRIENIKDNIFKKE